MEEIVPGMTAGAWLGPFCVGWLFGMLFGATGASAWWIVREAKSPQPLCRYSLQETLPQEVRSSRPGSP